MAFWKSLKHRYDLQRTIHHESRSPYAYALLGILFLITLIALVPLVVAYQVLSTSQSEFEVPTGISIQSLALAASKETIKRAFETLPYKNDPQRYRDLGLAIVRADNHFVFPYALSFWLAAGLVCIFAYHWEFSQGDKRPPNRLALIHWGLLTFGITALVGTDMGENYQLESLLVSSNPISPAALRFFAQTKFLLLALLSHGILFALLIGLRREIRFWTATSSVTSPQQKTLHGSFSQLIEREYQAIAEHRGTPGVKFKSRCEAAREPWVNYSNEDFIGLALSGGGIRSATFNLGLLQSLHRMNLLGHVDYLATVSGGGYIGAFWSRWLRLHAVHGRAPNEPFPDKYKQSFRNPNGDSREFEADEIRHLREFGKFLVPRSGFFDTETWGAIVAILAGVIPGLLAAISVLGLALILWLGVTFQFACSDLWARTMIMVCFTAIILISMELWWREAPTNVDNPRNRRCVELGTWLALGLIALSGCISINQWNVWMYSSELEIWFWKPIPLNYQNWWIILGIADPTNFSKGKLIWIPGLYSPSVGWAIVGGIFMAFRFRGVFAAPSMARRTAIPTNDRVAMRLLGLATAWAVMTTLWHISLNLGNSGSMLTYFTGGTAIGSAAIFAYLRNWFAQQITRPQRGGIVDRLKPLIPQLLAYLAVGMAWATLASLLISINDHDWMSWYATTALLPIPILFVLLADPQEFGLHAVYRDRICRAFLGAATSADATRSRMTDMQAGDDAPISCLLERPLQLVCCAANNVGGDHLSTLSRGARSAVVSRNGIAMGDSWTAQPKISLGGAITASAAAANSNMGSLSMKVGPAVSFLLAALNIRLGLWVDNPIVETNPAADRLLPGWRYFKEMTASTDTAAHDIHLSDGGHFDNLALYELVRRHCRYIIVSDATADPDIGFDDFGNTIRRIREDFGIEIEINIDELRPGQDGRSQQHAVVGTIDYGWFDKGILIYLKPTLTGDEPPDITQYKTRNTAFPHESTGDQFYDEAQWESYRRLGVHTGNKVLGFTEHIAANEKGRAQKVFTAAHQIWYPTPAGLKERSMQLTSRFSQLEQQLHSANVLPLMLEIFPEVAHAAVQVAPVSLPLSAQQEMTNLIFVLSALTLMEDTIAACDLQTNWRHPLNLGWVNSFARWATAPTFRRWWPVLKPMYGPALREFLEDRFEILRDCQFTASATVSEVTLNHQNLGFAHEWWKTRHIFPTFITGQKLFEYRILLPESPVAPAVPLEIALVAVTMNGQQASWTSEELFVPFSLWGSPLAVDFLDRLLVELRKRGIVTCKVEVKGPGELENNLAKWEERQSFVEYYRRSGFRLAETRPYPEIPENEQPPDGQMAILIKNLV